MWRTARLALVHSLHTISLGNVCFFSPSHHLSFVKDLRLSHLNVMLLYEIDILQF